MGLFDRIRNRWRARDAGPGAAQVQVADPRLDSWEVVRDYEDLRTARAFLHTVREAGIPAELASDWPLDRFGRGDISLVVPPESWSEAEELLSGLDLD